MRRRRRVGRSQLTLTLPVTPELLQALIFLIRDLIHLAQIKVPQQAEKTAKQVEKIAPTSLVRVAKRI